MTVLKSSQVVVAVDENSARSPVMRAAIDEALERGRKEGRAEAEMARTEALEAMVAALQETTEQTLTVFDTRVALDAQTVVAIAADLATWFLEGAVVAEPRMLVRSAEAVIAGTSGCTSVELLVHPDVAGIVAAVAPANVEVRADESLGRADHRIVVGEMVVERVWADALDDVGPAIAAALDVER